MPRRILAVATSALLASFAALSGATTVRAAGSQTFTDTGAQQNFIVPSGVTSVTVAASGASGGGAGGASGSVTATIPVIPGETLAVFVGGAGGSGTASAGGSAGFNGGAAGGLGTAFGGSGGGGASDVREGGSGLVDRVIVAGGGGGGSATGGTGGAGGGATGQSGANGAFTFGGAGGSQSAGGTLGSGGASCVSASNGALGLGGAGGADGGSGCQGGGGGGGSGYYGGGGGGGVGSFGNGSGAGGGGSSFAEAAATSVSNTQGAHTGNGQVAITYTTTAPAITSAPNATFTVGVAGSFTVTATGIPTPTLSDGGAVLPTGVTFVDNGNSTATLAGTPGAGTSGTYPFTITASNGTLPNATQSFTLTVPTAAANDNFVTMLYQDTLVRTPDAGGLSYWTAQMNAGASSATVAGAFLRSAEYRGDLVDQAYARFLTRSESQTERDFWTSYLSSGVTDEQLMAIFAGSSEYFADAGSSDSTFVSNLYRDMLDRSADSGGSAHWLSQLSLGASRGAVALAFATSHEHLVAVLAGTNGGKPILGDYVLYLDRAPDPMGLSFWSGSMDAGTPHDGVIAVLAASVEYFNLAQLGGPS